MVHAQTGWHKFLLRHRHSTGASYFRRPPLLGGKCEDELVGLIPHVQVIGIAGGDNPAVALVNSAI